MIIRSIVEFLKLLQSGQCPQDLRIYLHDEKIGVDGATQIANALNSGKCPQGLQLHLSNNNIGDDGVTQIANALKSGQCPQGLQIKLVKNYISVEGATQIANALLSGKCPPRLEINLGSNNIGSDGALTIASALKTGKCPQGLQIYLEDCNIGVDGATHIADALNSGKCPQGLQITLMDNNIGDEGASQIASALKTGKCPQGLQIDLGANNVGDDGITQIANALQSGKCPQGLHVYLVRNSISDAGATQITNAIFSGNCPAGLLLFGVQQSSQLQRCLHNVLLLEMENNSDDAIEQSSATWHKVVPIVLENYPRAIFSDILIFEKIANLLQDSIQSLVQQSPADISEMPYREQYFPAFLQIADIVLVLYTFAHKVSGYNKNKTIVSNILLTLEPALLPHTQRKILPDTQLWAKGQQCLLLEKAFALSKASRKDTVILRRFQEFYDAFNNVPSTLENLPDTLSLANLQADPKNAKAQAYLNKLEKAGLQLPKSATTRYGFFLGSLALDNQNDSTTRLKQTYLQ